MSAKILEYAPPKETQTGPSFYATVPTGATVFWRTFLPWQIVRFAWINLKMLIIIHTSHKSHCIR
jgi:hypothetical protein